MSGEKPSGDEVCGYEVADDGEYVGALLVSVFFSLASRVRGFTPVQFTEGGLQLTAHGFG